jgi:hypothetical protein
VAFESPNAAEASPPGSCPRGGGPEDGPRPLRKLGMVTFRCEPRRSRRPCHPRAMGSGHERYAAVSQSHLRRPLRWLRLPTWILHEDGLMEVANLRLGRAFRHLAGSHDRVVNIDARKNEVHCQSGRIPSFDDAHVKVSGEDAYRGVAVAPWRLGRRPKLEVVSQRRVRDDPRRGDLIG